MTFLLTDVEGSTALWEEAPDAMRMALARHDILFEVAIREHGGTHIRPRGEGDSRFAVFASAVDATCAALAVQRAFVAEAWPTPRPIKVRIGVHSGEARLRDGDYYGSAVNRCARLRGIGHGGQTLLSEATAVLVRDILPEGADLIDLGPHRLKDLTRPERVFQFTAPGLPTTFPTLASLDASPHNLPVQSTPLIGRQREIQALRALLNRGDARLVTLTGPGGIGKTRLAMQVAAELTEEYADGVLAVDLAPISDPSLVASTIAKTLGVADTAGRSALEALVDHMRGRRLLLLLDNFEQVLAAATDVDDMLRACPLLSVLVTSRAPLQLRGEHEFPVPPLTLPASGHLLTTEALSQCDAVALFVERATAIRPDFAITSSNAAAVVAICARLDGLPLAIELAAARLRLLSPEAMLSRLGHSLDLLTGGRRDLPARQQTLRSAIAWSYDLLPEGEQRLFRRLSVFVGGFALEAAERVTGDERREMGEPTTSSPNITHLAVFDLLASLVEHNLVRPGETPSGEPRFRMLETIREYALERLEASGEAADLRQRHLAWCLDLVEGGAHLVGGPDDAAWADRLGAEHDNLRAALGCSASASCDPELGLRLAGALRVFWSLRGHLREGRAWLTRLLARSSAPTLARARALDAAGYLALRQSDFLAATRSFEEALAIRRGLGDSRGLVETLRFFGLVPHHLRDYDRARAMLEESLSLARQVDNALGVRLALRFLADLARDRAEYAEAAATYEQSLTLARRGGDIHEIAYALRGLGHVARVRGEYARARQLLRESVRLLAGLRDRRCTPICLEGLACMEVGPGWAERAATLLGAAQAFQETTGAPASPAEMADYQRTEADARVALGGERFAAVWAVGAAMSLEEAIAYALVEPEADRAVEAAAVSGEARLPVLVAQATRPGPVATASEGPSNVQLSVREREVVALIAAGLSNRQIANQLVLSVRTVERHIENVYNRLGISGKAGRAIVTAYALRHRLVESA